MSKKKRSNRRGVALEMAITFLMLIFALCSLMTTLALVSRSQIDERRERFLMNAEINQMGENFCREVYWKKTDPTFDSFTYYYTGQTEKYYARIDYTYRDADGDGDEDTVYSLHVFTVKNNGFSRLIVKAYADETGCHVLSWTRVDPDDYT